MPRKALFTENEIPQAYWDRTEFVEEVIKGNGALASTDANPIKHDPVAEDLTPTLTEANKPKMFEEVNFKPTTIALQPEVEQVPEPPAPPVEPALLNANTSLATALEALEGVGKTTVEKLIRERNQKPFESLEDLQKRVPLKFGKQWADLKVTI